MKCYFCVLGGIMIGLGLALIAEYLGAASVSMAYASLGDLIFAMIFLSKNLLEN